MPDEITNVCPHIARHATSGITVCKQDGILYDGTLWGAGKSVCLFAEMGEEA